MADPTLQEQEEFEFRHRMEQEQGTAPSVEATQKSAMDKAIDYVGPEFLASAGLAATGAIAGPGIKKEIEAIGIPGLRPSAEAIAKGSLQTYLDTQLGVPKGTVSVEQLGKVVNLPIRTQSEVQDALALIKGKAGERVPVIKTIGGVPTVIRHEEIPARPPVDLSSLIQETKAATKGPGVVEGLRTAPLKTLVNGVEGLGNLANRIISPGYSQIGSRLIGGLGGLDVGLQGTNAVEHAMKGEYGRALSSGIGALGGAAALTRHPLLMPLGMGAAIAAPYVNTYLEGVAAKHPDLHMAEGGKVKKK